MLISQFRFRSLLPLIISLGAGCTGGSLDQPTDSHPAMHLRVQLVGAAAATVRSVRVELAEIPYCPASDVSGVWPYEPSAPTERGFVWSPIKSGDPNAVFEATVSNGGDPRAFGCWQRVPLIRFFRPELVSSPGIPNNLWDAVWTAPDTIVAYTMEAATFTPYGPGDAPIAVPPGYSILRRTCGSPDQPWRLEVVSASEPVLFHPPESFVPPPQPLPSPAALLEQSERALLDGCQVTLPASDLGRRVSFDRPVSLAFSPDGASLYTLTPIDTADAGLGAALRSVNLTDGSLHQLLEVPRGRALTIAANGDIYVATQSALVRVDRPADGTVGATTLPISGGIVSPDGRWIAYLTEAPGNPDGGSTLALMDVMTAEVRLVVRGGYPVGWTPASLLLLEQFGQDHIEAYLLRDPSSGEEIERYPFSTAGYGRRVLWGTDSPIMLTAPMLWTQQQPAARDGWSTYERQDERDFGLTLTDLRSGDARAALEPQAGSISYTATTPGFAFFWARKCKGLFETVCSFTLHQVDLGTGAYKLVAVADSEAPVAVSPMGDRVAIAVRDGVYVKDLR